MFNCYVFIVIIPFLNFFFFHGIKHFYNVVGIFLSQIHKKIYIILLFKNIIYLIIQFIISK